MLTAECPFCCTIDGVCPQETNEKFNKIYNEIKGKSTEEIEAYTQAYLPSEPENNSIDIEFLFY